MRLSVRSTFSDTSMMCLVGLWSTVAAAGLYGVLFHFETAQGAIGVTPVRWPAATNFTFNSALPTMITFIHPQCGCSAATIDELARLMARVHGKVDASVAVYLPESADEDWDRTNVVQRARSIPGVRIAQDIAGSQSELFGAETSGYTVLYAADGSLMFGGGITGSRGHSGDNIGRASVTELITGDVNGEQHTPVYGCGIHDPALPSLKESNLAL